MKKQSATALKIHARKAASLKAKATKAAVRGATRLRVPPSIARSAPESFPMFPPPNEHPSNGKRASDDRQTPRIDVEKKNEHEAGGGAQKSTAEPQRSVNSDSRVIEGMTAPSVVCGLFLLLVLA